MEKQNEGSPICDEIVLTDVFHSQTRLQVQ